MEPKIIRSQTQVLKATRKKKTAERHDKKLTRLRRWHAEPSISSRLSVSFTIIVYFQTRCQLPHRCELDSPWVRRRVSIIFTERKSLITRDEWYLFFAGALFLSVFIMCIFVGMPLKLCFFVFRFLFSFLMILQEHRIKSVTKITSTSPKKKKRESIPASTGDSKKIKRAKH